MEVVVSGLLLKSGATMLTFAASSAMLSAVGGSVVRRAGSGWGWLMRLGCCHGGWIL